MQTSRWTLKGCGLLVTAAVLAVGVAVPAARAEDNLPDAMLFRDLMTALGLRPSNQAPIDYRERSPLVLPKTDKLPPPETRSLAARNPNWPEDYDVKLERKYKAEQANRNPFVGEEQRKESEPVMPSELEAPRRGAPAGSARSSPMGPGPVGQPDEPSALGYVGGLFDSIFDKDKPESKPFTGEPARTALTDPPPGYQTPSPSAAYGVGKQKFNTPVYNPMTMQEETPPPSQ